MKTTGIHIGEYSKSSYTVTDGVMTWDSNGNVPPEDVVAKQAATDSNISVAECDRVRSEQFDVAVAAYRTARSNRTPGQIAEERAEARAEIGPGVKLVDIITGEQWTT